MRFSLEKDSRIGYMNGMSVPPELRIGVLGCSRIARRSVIPAILKTPGWRLVAVGNRTAARAREVAEEFKVSACTLEELVAHPEIDALYISLPNSLHEEWALSALAAGKHVLVEKPMAGSLAATRRMVEAAASKGRILMEGLMYVFHPAIRKVHELIRAGRIGNIRSIEATFGFPEMPDGDIRHDPALGGGATLDLLIYPLSFALEAAGAAPERITHHVVRHARHPVDGLGHVQLDWPAFSAQIRYGFACAYRNEVLVWGDQGRIQLARAFTAPPDHAQVIELQTGAGREEIRVEPADHFALMLAGFADTIHRRSDSARNTGEDVLGRMVIIDEVAASCRAPAPAPVISVVIPVYKSESILQSTVTEIQEALAAWCPAHEIVLVNDGSPDGSRDVMDAMATADDRIRPVHLMRNFGQHNAIMAGLHQARGQFIVTMDDDGQHDPNDIRALVEKVRTGLDVAYASFDDKVDTQFKNWGSRLNDRMANRLLEKPEDLYLCSFKAFTRELRDQILRYTGPAPYVDGLIVTSTRKIGVVPSRHRGTTKGASTYSLRKLIHHWLNMFANFSVKPLRAIFFLGLITSAMSVVALLYVLAWRMVAQDPPPGWTTIAILLLFFGSAQLISLGLVGEYVGRVLLHLNSRPQFIVRSGRRESSGS